jgi:hypothetical protein
MDAYAPPRQDTVERPLPKRLYGANGRLVIQIVLYFACLAFGAPVWVLAVLLLAEHYISLPLIVQAGAFHPMRQIYKAFDLRSHPQGSQIERFLDQTSERLKACGFALLGSPLEMVTAKGPVVSTITVATVFQNAAGERAVVAAICGVTPTRVPIVTKGSIFLHTRFSDGSERITSNGMSPSIFPRNGLQRGESFPVDDPARLYELHAATVSRDLERRTIARYDEAEAAQWLSAQHAATMERVARAGYFWRSEAKQVYVKTLWGAYMMSLKIIWPMKEIRTFFLRQRAMRLMRKLGGGIDAVSIRLDVPPRNRVPWSLFFTIAIYCVVYTVAQDRLQHRGHRLHIPQALAPMERSRSNAAAP